MGTIARFFCTYIRDVVRMGNYVMYHIASDQNKR
jgi:hypothetical protein